MSNPPSEGRGTKGEAPGLSSGGSQDASHPGGKRDSRHMRRSIPKLRPQARTQHAIDDAQQGLRSLLTPPTDDKYPHIISPSGATRSHRHGRVAGPVADPEHTGATGEPGKAPPNGAYLLEGKDTPTGS